MSKKMTLAPKLRFPEFLESGEWEKKPLEMVANVIAGQSPDGSNYNDKGIGMPFYQGKTDFGDVYINRPTKWTTQVTKIAESGDILMSVRAPVGALNICVDQICIGRGLAAIQAKQNKWYLYYFLNRIQKSIVGNGGAIFDAINKDQIEEITTFIPSPPEQQKIADCLTSLDELIAAERAQLDALKAYKKGLLQNLFPAEGESVPALRFPEFQSAGEWEEKILGGFANVVASGDLNAEYFSPTPSPQHIYPVYSNSVDQEGLYGYYSISKYPNNSITITARGTLGVAFVRRQDFMGIGRLIVVSDLKDVNPKFLMECWNHLVSIPQEVTSIPQLTAVTAKSIVLPIPSLPEQQKIAEMLTSIDEEIAAQGQRVAALQVHKQGLLQGLFPREAAGEVE